jgi:hypothetical protein
MAILELMGTDIHPIFAWRRIQFYQLFKRCFPLGTQVQEPSPETMKNLGLTSQALFSLYCWRTDVRPNQDSYIQRYFSDILNRFHLKIAETQIASDKAIQNVQQKVLQEHLVRHTSYWTAALKITVHWTIQCVGGSLFIRTDSLSIEKFFKDLLSDVISPICK